jgi:thiamine biosynthesis lipoprotein
VAAGSEQRLSPRRSKAAPPAVVVLGACVVLAAAACSLSAGGCAAGRAPYTASREVLGTAITLTVWGDDPAALPLATEKAFAEMARVEAALDPYDATSAIAAINASPYGWHDAPPPATRILDRIGRLGMARWFSPTLLAVTRLYDFGGRGSVPATAQLAAATAAAASAASELSTDTADRYPRRMTLGPTPPTMPPGSTIMTPALDFGGAAKGLAIDGAVAELRAAPGVRAVMVTAGSSTQVWGAKPDGEPWRIGIEDPRDTGRVIAVIGSPGPGPVNVSTSGDYQLFFERDGVRYHHILDPATGRPARGLRSLTVYGSLSGLDADILSTALFVMGPSPAREWATRNGVGLYMVDDRGRATTVPAPGGANVTFERVAAPAR